MSGNCESVRQADCTINSPQNIRRYTDIFYSAGWRVWVDISDEAGVDANAAERGLHLVDDPPDFQTPVADHRHRVVVVPEMLGVGDLVRVRRVT